MEPEVPILKSNGVTIDFEQSGRGDAVVLVPGGSVTNSFWNKVGPRLAQRYRVLAINLYGYGGTDPWPGEDHPTHGDEAAIVRALVEHCAGPVHLIGHSYGAAASLHLALADSSRLRSLTLIEPSVFDFLAQAGEREILAETLAWRDRFFELAGRGELNAAWTTAVERLNGKGAWENMSEHARQWLRDTTPLFLGGFDANFEQALTLQQCREIGLPTLLVHGERTMESLARITEVLSGTIPGCRHVVIAGAAHMSPLTHPEEIYTAIEGHLRQTDGAAE